MRIPCSQAREGEQAFVAGAVMRKMLWVALSAALVMGTAAYMLWPQPSVSIPEVIGEEAENAERTLRAAGFDVKRTGYGCPNVRNLDSLERVVVAQTPDPQTLLRKRSTVQIKITVKLNERGETLSCSEGWPSRSGNDARNALWGVFWVIGPTTFAFLAAADMRRRGERGWLWGVFVFFLFPIGLPVWLIVRRGLPVRDDILGPNFSAWGPQHNGDS